MSIDKIIKSPFTSNHGSHDQLINKSRQSNQFLIDKTSSRLEHDTSKTSDKLSGTG